MKKALLAVAISALALAANDARADSVFANGELTNIVSYTAASDTQTHDGYLVHYIVEAGGGGITRGIRFGGTQCPTSLSTTQLQTLTTAMIARRSVTIYSKPGTGYSMCLVGFGIGAPLP